MFQTLILICAIGTAPAECTTKTAVDIVFGQKVSLQQCMFGGQAMIASTETAPEAGKQYSKVVCDGRQNRG